MRLVDAHTHAWGVDTPELPWTAATLPPEWDGPYPHGQLVEDMDAVGVDESVVVTTPLYGRGQRANEYTMRCIEAHPDRLYGVGLVDFYPEDDDALKESVRRVTSSDRMLGVRMHAPFEYAPVPSELNPEADWILDESLDPIWEGLAETDSALFVFPKAQQLSMVATLADRHPDVPLVVDHMAWPGEDTAPDESPWTDFETVAERDNVYVKVSSLPRSSADGWPYRDLWPYVRNLLEWFGPERLMLGSDYPWMDSWDDYDRCLSWVEETDVFSAQDLAHLSYRTFDDLHGV